MGIIGGAGLRARHPTIMPNNHWWHRRLACAFFASIHYTIKTVKKAGPPLGHGFFRLKKPGPLS
jgi:hypothetical protein